MEQPQKVILRLCSILLALCVHFQRVACNVKLIVALPNLNNQQQMLLPYWERGQEILQGARLAEQQINNSSNSEVQLQIELIDVNNGQCSAAGVNNYNLLEEIIEQLTQNHDLDFVAVVGLHCNNEFQYLMQPTSLNATSSQQKFKSVHKELIEEMLQNQIKPAPTHLIEAMFKFVNMSGWQNIGIMTEVKDTYFSRTAEEVHNKAKSYTTQFNVTKYQQLQSCSHGVTLPANISKITLLSTSLQTAEDILCQAQRRNMIWPEYVWILHSFLLQDVNSTCTSCSTNKNCFEGTIIVRKEQSTCTYCNTFSNVKPSKQHTDNPHSKTLHDLIVETIIVKYLNLNISSNCSAPKPGAITVTQVRNSTEIPIAEISGEQILIIDGQVVNTLKVISDEHDIQFIGAPTAYIVIYLLGVSVGVILVTINLVCYIIFRNEPEVKASSFMLSMLIFLGNYLQLFYPLVVLPVHQRVVEIPEIILNAACLLNAWISGLSIPGTLVLATVLMKILRVYNIKRLPRMAKRFRKVISDRALFVYILLLLLPNVTIVTVWTAIDRLKIAYVTSFMPGFKQKICISNHLIVWSTSELLYQIVLYSTVVVVAIKSRKIRSKHFEDSRWLNRFVILLIPNSIVSLSIFLYLKHYTSVPDYVSSIPSAYVAHLAGVFISQLCLITPKTLPPLKRSIHSRISKSFVKQKPQTEKIYSTKHSLY